jgi:hypothetical protein
MHMTRLARIGLFVVLALPSWASAAEPARIPKSLVIALDGLRADGLEAADAPRIRALIDGHWQPGYRCAYAYYAQTIKDATTGSGPNHTTIFTGVTANAHHVRGNIDKQMAAVKYPDYFAMLRQFDAKLSMARLSSWKSDELVPSGADAVCVARHATTAARGTGMIAGTYEDPRWPRGRDIDALLVFLNDPDSTGHATGFGPSNPKYLAVIHTLDGYVGGLLDAIAARPTFGREDWQVILTTDHGGYQLNHGTMEACCYGVPLVVSSREANQGLLAGVPSLADVVPTVLQHMGVGPTHTFTTVDGVRYNLPGEARGDDVRAPDARRLTDGLIVDLPFDGSLTDVAGTLKPTVGGGTPTYVDGKFGKAIHLAPGTYVTLAPPGRLPIDRGDFTLAFWYRVPADQKGDPVILGDKEWSGRDNPGLLLTASVGRDKNDVGLNLASPVIGRCDAYRIDVRPNQWWLVAATVRRDGPVMLYAGGPDGTLQFISNDATHLADDTGPLPLNLGQDGTGKYPFGLTADVEQLAVWDRALSLDEVRQLYNKGAGAKLGDR